MASGVAADTVTGAQRSELMFEGMWRTRRLARRTRRTWPILVAVLSAPGCNETGPETFSVHGTWTGSVAEPVIELEMVLIEQGDAMIIGFAEMTSVPTGTVQGEVSGARDGADVTVTLDVDGVIVAGSVVFEGSFEDEDTLAGTISSGLLAGSFDITLLRKPV
jgi:hypothetical protein